MVLDRRTQSVGGNMLSAIGSIASQGGLPDIILFANGAYTITPTTNTGFPSIINNNLVFEVYDDGEGGYYNKDIIFTLLSLNIDITKYDVVMQVVSTNNASMLCRATRSITFANLDRQVFGAGAKTMDFSSIGGVLQSLHFYTIINQFGTGTVLVSNIMLKAKL